MLLNIISTTTHIRNKLTSNEETVKAANTKQHVCRQGVEGEGGHAILILTALKSSDMRMWHHKDDCHHKKSRQTKEQRVIRFLQESNFVAQSNWLQYMDISFQLLGRANWDFLEHMITGNETWVYHIIPETKVNYMTRNHSFSLIICQNSLVSKEIDGHYVLECERYDTYGCFNPHLVR